MKPGWVAGSVRARLLADRSLGPASARAVAAAGSVERAVGLIAASSYGREVRDEMGLTEAERGVRATTLWYLRVLAGWLPPGRSEVVRVLAGGFEIANIEAHLDELAGGPHTTEPFDLGALATVWPRVRQVRSTAEIRRVLASSPWGDPAADDRASLSAALRVAWARRIAEELPDLRPWATAGAAIVVANERFGNGRELSPAAAIEAGRLLGRSWASSTFGSFAVAVPADVRWVFTDVVDASGLWWAEAVWRRRLAEEAARRVGRAGSEATIAWSAVLLLVDAQRVCAALEAAAWGPVGLEAFDAVA